MEKISLIVDKLNGPPFNKKIFTLTEFDGKSSMELLEYTCEAIVAIDPEQDSVFGETTDNRIQRILQFLSIMKFSIPEDQYEDFQNLLMSGDKDILHTILHWLLSRLEHLQKRAYLAKYLMPVDVPPEFANGDDLIIELMGRVKDLQADFKEIHKNVDQLRSTGTKPSELKAEIQQLEQERTQLEAKIKRMQKDMNVDEDRFKEMLKATSALRKEQENEVLHHERLREHRKLLQEADMRLNDSNKRFSELKKSGVQTQSAEQILNKLQNDVKDLSDKRESIERSIAERELHLEKLQSWDNNDKVTTEEDVRSKRDQVRDYEDQISVLQERLDSALEKNTKLVVFRQASTMALKKYREREDEVDKLNEELRRINRQIEEKESDLKASGKNGNKLGKKDLKKYGAVVRDKIEKYKKMKEELSSLRSELVVLQRTEQILKSRNQNLEEFLADLERQKGVEGYRDTQRALIEMSERTAEVDQIKGATLEEISVTVEQIGKEFKKMQTQLQPLISELKNVRVEYMDVESQYQEKKSMYDKVAVGLDMEKQTLEKEANSLQDECLREESKFHYLQNLIFIAKIKLERCDQEKKWQNGHGRMLPDFATLKQLYEHKLNQQDQLTKQLRKKQKELKENSGALTNQKTNFSNLQALLNAKIRCANPNNDGILSLVNDRADEKGYVPIYAAEATYADDVKASGSGKYIGYSNEDEMEFNYNYRDGAGRK
eukprot:gene4215-5990_t